MIPKMSKPMRRRRTLRLRISATIAALGLTAGGCGLSDGAGFGDENDGDCISSKRVPDEPVVCLEGRLVTMPVPSDAEYNEIIKTIEGFGPKSRIDTDTFAVAPLNVCESLLRGASPAEIAPDAAEWFGSKDDNLTATQAEKIVDLIKTQGWCVL